MSSVNTVNSTLRVEDGVELAYTLRYPRQLDLPATTKIAIIAHPYGRLGGSKDDHVVIQLSRLLARDGWAVVTFDARGCGSSTGSASFKGVIEAEDYSRVLLQVLVPLVRPPSQLDSGVLSPIQLILAGYSFGALQAIATSPPFITGLQFFTRYLLVSYPLSVVWALTLGNYARCLQDLKRVIANNHPILATYGDSDQFTSLSKYSVWADELAGHGGAFRGLKVDGADHFWGTQMGELLVSVQAWLDDTRQSTEVTVQ